MIQFTHITNLISELLFKHDCVIVPNFGGFVARNYGSSFNKGNNVLSPPTKQILFNKNLIHNDGLLVAELMKKNTIGFEASTKLIDDYRAYIQSLLSAKKRFELINLGLLFIDAENNLRFEAKADVNFLFDSFGFEPIVANQLVFEAEPPVVTVKFEDRKAIAQPVLKSKKQYAKIAALAIGAPAVMAFLLLAAYSKPMQPLMQSSANPFYTPEKTYSPNKTNYTKTYFIDDVAKPALLADANGYAAFKLNTNGTVLIANVNDTIEKSDKTFVQKPAFSKSAPNQFNGKFQVVVGCFGIEQNAEKLINDLAAHHINAGISGVNNKGLHVVSCGGFNSKQDATALLQNVRAIYPNAWIMAK